MIFCLKNNIPLLKVKHINDKESISSIGKYELDWLFIIIRSQIASKDVVEKSKIRFYWRTSYIITKR